MSELANKQNNGQALRLRLLATASVLALLGGSIGSAMASDDDTGRPVLWLELGGQFDFLNDDQQKLAPPFVWTSRRQASPRR